jgi:hypothetical protein
MMRSGTTVFRRLLDLNGATDLGEIFSNKRFPPFDHLFFRYVHERALELPGLVHPDNYSVLLDDFLAERASLPAPLVVDIKAFQSMVLDFGHAFGAQRVYENLRQRGARFVHVKRRNLLRARVSRKIAEATGVWSRRPEEQASSPTIVNLDTRWLRDILDEESRVIVATGSALMDAIEVYYEEMFDPTGGVVEPLALLVSDLTGTPVAAAALTARLDMTRQNPGPLCRLISNYDDVAATLRGTEYEWMLTA